MDNLNLLPIIVAALLPSIIGFIYYNPKVLGNAWMKELGKTSDELMEGFNMPLVTIIGLVMSFLLAFIINANIELNHKECSEVGDIIYASHHTFGHGALHGLVLGLLVVFPIFITNGLYERKSWKLILINAFYWTITIALMSGLMDAWN